MKLWHVCCIIFTYISLSESYSKYGRTCKDIGCLSNEVCVMETDPCSYYQRQNECGSYPTCKKVQNAGPPSCKNYVCPPTKVCKMDGATPKCVDDHSKADRVGYDTSELKNNDQPSAGGNLYPRLNPGETTPRPNIGYQGGGQGYQGGQIGSGYPGQAKPGYPQQQNYPQQPYPGYNGYNNRYNNNGYPQQGYGGHNQQGYPNNYNYNNQRYPNQGYNNPYGQQNRYGQNTASGGIVDSISNALKKYGTDLLKNAIAKQIAGGNH